MECNINLGLQGVPASFLISPPRLLCLSDQHFVDYRGKLDSIMEPSTVPTLGFSLPIFVFSWKPSDQGSVGCSPERILPDKKNRDACPKILQCKTVHCLPSLNETAFDFLQMVVSLIYYISFSFIFLYALYPAVTDRCDKHVSALNTGICV